MNPRRGRTLPAILALFLLLVATACGPTRVTRELVRPSDVAQLDQESPFLKAHMRDGSVYVLSDWSVSNTKDSIHGHGDLLDFNRVTRESGMFTLAMDSVLLFESNVMSDGPAKGPLIGLTIVTVSAAAYCLANPKACFGSCPTFFAETDDGWELLAEGFSASVAPCLEATDVDALARWRPRGSRVELKMTNDAYETHVVRHADLLAAPLRPGERAGFTANGTIRTMTEFLEPKRATAREGDCLPQIRDMDDLERFSLADSTNLAATEFIDLQFDVPESGEWGLMLGMRQSLMTTYLFYQGLAYLGTNAGQWLAKLEAMPPAQRQKFGTLWSELGGVKVQLETGASYTTVGEVTETGPLAIDYDVVELPAMTEGETRLRLELTKGLWRIDYVSLVRLGEEIEPIRLQPSEVLREGKADEDARRLLMDRDEALVTLPGDEYRLIYEMPDGASNWELFLESRGYYLEWMRDEWLADENPQLAAKMLLMPRQALRDMAPAFKAMEPEMETLFWESRYVRQ